MGHYFLPLIAQNKKKTFENTNDQVFWIVQCLNFEVFSTPDLQVII